MAIKEHQLLLFEKRLMWIGIPVFMGAFFMGTQQYNEPFWRFLNNSGRELLLAVLHWYVIRHLYSRLRRRYPQYHQSMRRVLATIALGAPVGMILATLITNVPEAIAGTQALSVLLFLSHFGPMFFFGALVTGAHEVLYNFFELRRIAREKEVLEKAHLQSQLDSLKSQVNPHFLFNSLNTLLSIIPTSPQQAEQFVIELSSVYRYLLQANESQLSTLQQELQFARSYFHLLKSRFGSAIHLDIQVPEAALHLKLPSLTLQLLLENAVKHNVISGSKPLSISLYTEGPAEAHQSSLVVKNNLQPKDRNVLSSRMGLNNIAAKYKLLNHGEVVIRAENNFFTVRIPLLAQTETT